MSTPSAIAMSAAPIKFDYSRAFQARMLRTLVQDPDFACTTGVFLLPEHFEKRAHRWLAKKILGYAKKHGSGIGQDALDIELDRDLRIGTFPGEDKAEVLAFFAKLKNPIKDRSFIKEEVYRFVKNQVTRQAILSSLDHLEGHDFESIDKEFQRVLEVQESLSGGLGQFFVRDVSERTSRRKSYEKNGVSTGLRIDDYLKPGGLPPKSLGCVVAPSGKGKSHVLVHLGKSGIIDSNAKVLHVTLELSEDSVLDRYDAAFAGVSISLLEKKRITVRDKVKELGATYGECLVVKEFPPASLTVPALRAYIRQLERMAFYPSLVLVDYADLMLPSHASRDRDAYEDMGNIYTELRRLSYEVNAPVWTASQTQRSALNKPIIDIDSISDSFKKAMIADLVICLSQTVEEKKAKVARFFLAKNRLGPDKLDLKVHLDWSRSTIKDA